MRLFCLFWFDIIPILILVFILFLDKSFSFVTYFVSQTSNRSNSSYLTYSKEFANAIRAIRFLQKSGFDLGKYDSTFPLLYSSLRLPFSRLGEYSLEFSVVFEDLDDQAKKSVSNATKTLDGLLRKCQTHAIPKT